MTGSQSMHALNVLKHGAAPTEGHGTELTPDPATALMEPSVTASGEDGITLGARIHRLLTLFLAIVILTFMGYALNVLEGYWKEK